MNWIGMVLVAAGLFAIIGAVLDWDWYMNHRKARRISAILGRNGARIFYVIFGLGMSVLGVLITLGIIKNNS